MNAPLPLDEAQRLESLRRHAILDTPPEPDFDDLTLLAAHICQTPVALVSLVDETRQWFKSRIGLDLAQTPRDQAFCAHAILHRDEIMEVPDARIDPRFADNPLVIAEPHIRFYAGAPLMARDGHALGSLCVIDHQPRTLTPAQRTALRALSRQVVAQLELRRRAGELAVEIAERERAESRLRHQFALAEKSDHEAGRLLLVAERSRRALLSVLEDEKRAGQNLRASEERFRQLAENINEVFWMTDPATPAMLYVSPAYEKIWGRTCASLYQTPADWIEAIHPEDRLRVRDAAPKMIRGDYEETYRVIRPDGTIRWVRDRAFPVRNAAGAVYRVAGVAEDITERVQIEEQFRQSQKLEAIGQLSGGVAHDFNNLLTVIKGNLALLPAPFVQDAETASFLAEISEAADRAAGLTHQLLSFSRRQVLRLHEVDLNAVVADMSRMLRRIVGEDITMEILTPAPPNWVLADSGMIEQVLLNLVVNARDAMPRGGRLCIEAGPVDMTDVTPTSDNGAHGPLVCLTVSDTGSGISPEVRARIFEPFFTTKEIGKGTGLGLATVYGIVQQHRGWITLESEVGCGSMFRVFLPRIKNRVSPASASKPVDARARSPAGETILVVEDEESVRRLVQTVLTQEGYQVFGADSGAAALEVWKNHRESVDVLLTDLIMPLGVRGFELAEQLMEEKPGLRVIYTSGYSSELANQDSPLREGHYFLPKPFTLEALLAVVRQSLDGSS